MKKFFLIPMIAFLIISLWMSIALAGSKTLDFTWTQVMSTGFGGWYLYKSASPNVTVNATNKFATIPYSGTPGASYSTSQIMTSPDGQSVPYYFVLTAFDTSGNESTKSNEVIATIDFESPGVPTSLTVTVRSVP